MRAAVHQPQFLPYPGFFHKLSLVDLWVVMDGAQYDKRFTNRNRILAPTGPIWLTVPIDKTQKFSKNMDVRVNNSLPWREEHWKKLRYSYGNARWFDEYGPSFEKLYGGDYSRLIELDLEATRMIMRWLGLQTEVVLESELGVSSAGTQRLIDACRAVGAETYVSGPGGRNYIDPSGFDRSSVKLEYQQYRPKPYRQRFGSGFVPDLSVVDLLFNIGPESGRYVKDPTPEQKVP